MKNPKVVQKVWGLEVWLVNKEYCGKLLLLKKNHRCSLHYHKEKDETFYVNKGVVLFELGNKIFTIRKGDTVHIPRKKKHRFTGITKSEIIEFSTHHKDSDSYRIEESGKIK